jgi:hypothetical protein
LSLVFVQFWLNFRLIGVRLERSVQHVAEQRRSLRAVLPCVCWGTPPNAEPSCRATAKPPTSLGMPTTCMSGSL